MVKVTKRPVVELEAELEKYPKRVAGRWTEVCNDVKKTKTGVEITGLTRGQAWGLMRTAKNAGLTARVLEKGTKVIILPAK